MIEFLGLAALAGAIGSDGDDGPVRPHRWTKKQAARYALHRHMTCPVGHAQPYFPIFRYRVPGDALVQYDAAAEEAIRPEVQALHPVVLNDGSWGSNAIGTYMVLDATGEIEENWSASGELSARQAAVERTQQELIYLYEPWIDDQTVPVMLRCTHDDHRSDAPHTMFFLVPDGLVPAEPKTPVHELRSLAETLHAHARDGKYEALQAPELIGHLVGAVKRADLYLTGKDGCRDDERDTQDAREMLEEASTWEVYLSDSGYSRVLIQTHDTERPAIWISRRLSRAPVLKRWDETSE